MTASSHILDRLGVSRIINARGNVTEAGGSLMSAETLQAIREGAMAFVQIEELNIKAGQYVAEMIGVAAAHVTAGAAAGMMLSAAACIARSDPRAIRRLPNIDNGRNEIVVQKTEQPNYVYQAMRAAGAKLVEVGSYDRMSISDVEAGITEHCAAIQLYLGRPTQPSIADVARISKHRSLPIIVDAAAELPPRRNLTQPLSDGADLVVFSGGKAIRGPQNTGLIVGTQSLVESCRLNASPNKAIGRCLKVSKEDICGLVAALEQFVAGSDNRDNAMYWSRARFVESGLRDIPDIVVSIRLSDGRSRPDAPRVYLRRVGFSSSWVRDVATRLAAGNPPIVVKERVDAVCIDLMTMSDAELGLLCKRLRSVLTDVHAVTK